MVKDAILRADTLYVLVDSFLSTLAFVCFGYNRQKRHLVDGYLLRGEKHYVINVY